MDSQRIRIHGTKVQAGDRRGGVRPSVESSRCGEKVTNNFEHLNFTVIPGSGLWVLGRRFRTRRFRTIQPPVAGLMAPTSTGERNSFNEGQIFPVMLFNIRR